MTNPVSQGHCDCHPTIITTRDMHYCRVAPNDYHLFGLADIREEILERIMLDKA